MFQLHIVHFNDKYSSLDDAADKSDGLAVLGLLFEVSVEGYHTVSRLLLSVLSFIVLLECFLWKVDSAHSGLNPVTNSLSSVVTAGKQNEYSMFNSYVSTKYIITTKIYNNYQTI